MVSPTDFNMSRKRKELVFLRDLTPYDPILFLNQDSKIKVVLFVGLHIWIYTIAFYPDELHIFFQVQQK